MCRSDARVARPQALPQEACHAATRYGCCYRLCACTCTCSMSSCKGIANADTPIFGTCHCSAQSRCKAAHASTASASMVTCSTVRAAYPIACDISQTTDVVMVCQHGHLPIASYPYNLAAT